MKKCKHEWRYKSTDGLVYEFYYCVHCLAKAMYHVGRKEYSIIESKEVKKNDNN